VGLLRRLLSPSTAERVLSSIMARQAELEEFVLYVRVDDSDDRMAIQDYLILDQGMLLGLDEKTQNSGFLELRTKDGNICVYLMYGGATKRDVQMRILEREGRR